MKKHVRKIVLVLLAVLLVLGGFTPALAVDMEDVFPNNWFYRYVMRALDVGLITNESENGFYFEPHRSVTRAEFITMLGRLHEYGEDNTIDIPVDGTSYGRYLTWSVEMGIVQGNQHGDLMPHAPITREQMAVIVDRYIRVFELWRHFPGGTPNLHPHRDHREGSDWAFRAVMDMAEYRLIHADHWGGVGWYFRPRANLSHAEAVTVFVRMYRGLYEGLRPMMPEEN